MSTTTALSSETEALGIISQGALVVVNHSGGKDSQAMLARLAVLVPRDQILVIHAHLPDVEWAGTWEHVKDDARRHGVQAIQVRAGKTLLEMVERRRMWPSASTRQCTSDLKRGPIEKAVRAHLKANPQFGGYVVSAMGLRAEESAARSKQPSWKREDRNSKAGRNWYRWLPIHDMKIREVFETIASAGGSAHWAYAEGMSRLSCVFCIMASECDLRTAARLNPDLYRRYVSLEKKIGHTLRMDGRGLEQVTGLSASPSLIENEQAA